MRTALVDPSRTTRLIVTRMLEACGHEVVAFDDEREALQRIKIDLRIEAVITSADPAHMSGLELCWETRLLATCQRPIYVLMMSSEYASKALSKRSTRAPTISSASRRSPRSSMRGSVPPSVSPRCITS